MKVQNSNAVDLMAMLGNSATADKANQNSAFAGLLKTVIKGTDDATMDMGKVGKGKSQRSAAREAVMDLAAAAQGAQIQSQEPVADNAVQDDLAVETLSVAVTQQAQATGAADPLVQALLDEAQATGETVNLTASIPVQQQVQVQTAQVAVDVPEELRGTGEPQDKFGAMLDQAQQELQAITVVQEDVVEVVEETGLPEPPETEEPLEEGEVLVEDSDDGEAEPALPETQVKQSESRTKSQSNLPTMDQKPLSELPERDRAVMNMKETKQEPDKEAVTAAQAVAADSKPEPVQPQPVQEPQQAQPEQPASRTDQADQVYTEATRNLELGKTEFRMQLMPEELGKIDVKMVLEGGRLAVEIMAATPKAAELLNRQAESLAQALRLQEFDVQSIQVVTEAGGASGYMEGAFNMLNGQTQESGDQIATGGNTGNGSPSADATTESAAQERARSPESLLDYAI